MKIKIIICSLSLLIWIQYGFSEVLDRETIVVSPIRISTQKTSFAGSGTFEIYFKTGSARITESQMKKLDKIIPGDGTVVIINGHSSATGYEKQNFKLSRFRAEAVQKVLSGKYPGIRFDLHYYGSKKPKYNNRTFRGRNGNQRVVIIVR